MTTKATTIEELEARLDIGGTVTRDEWMKAEAADKLAEARATAETTITERTAEAERRSAIEARRTRIEGPWTAAQAVIDARARAVAAYAELHAAVDTLVDDWSEECRALRDLEPGQHVVRQEGPHFTVTTRDGATLYGIHRHLAAQLIAEEIDGHYRPGERPGELRALYGSAPEHRHTFLTTLAAGEESTDHEDTDQ